MATRLLERGMKALGINDELLRGTPGSELRKVALASAIDRQTTVSQSWIAEHLWMRSAANVSQQVRRLRKSPSAKSAEVKRCLKQLSTIAD